MRPKYGGKRIAWADLSTGINPIPYPLPALPQNCWTALPDDDALAELMKAARRFWQVPDAAAILAAPGASVLIALIPALLPAARVVITQPTYNEHAAAFAHAGWHVVAEGPATAQVVVHPNNPDGRLWKSDTLPSAKASLTVIDESFCDVVPDVTLMHRATRPGTLILKSFGKFWGLAGLRLGFAIGDPNLIETLRARLGPWAVAGPALAVGTHALQNLPWATATRSRLAQDSDSLDALMRAHGAEVVGGTSLFRLYRVEDAKDWQHRLATHHIWTRVFPYDPRWLRIGIPHPLHWARLRDALRP